MRAMMMKGDGNLKMQQVEIPKMKDDEVLIKVIAAGVNRCDLLQKTESGSFVPKANCPGHECSGIITAVGKYIAGEWKVGDQVCALLNGGGYAEQVAVPAKQLLPVPQNVSLADAASLPYAACNVWLALSNVHMELIDPKRKRTVLIHQHENASDSCVMAIQFAKYKGMKVIVTAETIGELALSSRFGADVCINRKVEPFINAINRATEHRGVDVILDYGSPYLRQSATLIRPRGCMLILDLLEEMKFNIHLGYLVATSALLQVISIRNQSPDEKASIIAQVRENIWPIIEEGIVKPPNCRRYPLSAATMARQLLVKKQNEHTLARILLYP